jgi:flagellar basal body rod protein FlgG
MSGPGRIGPGAQALKYWERRQEVVSNNLANVSTPGFKGQRVFARLLTQGAAPVAQIGDDFRSGSVSKTGRKLDLALESDGFLVVRTGQGERYVRGGSLHLDEAGTLVTEEGHEVMSDGGPMVLPPGEVVVHADGMVLVDGTQVGRLRVERPAKTPVREGERMWVPQGGGEEVPREEVRIEQGHLEESNIDPVSALVEMIEIQRAYGAVQRSIQENDAAMHTITTDIGRVG